MTQLNSLARRKFATLLACGWLAVAGSTALAQTSEQAPGVVKTVSGQAFVDYNGQRYIAQIGTPIYLRSQLVTGPGSSIGVTFRDQTVISLGPDSHLSIDQYLFSPNEGKAGLVATMARGTLNYVSGLIAKLKPDGVSVNTPTAVIGVRGTQFVVRVDPT
jgi:hypothetical protein